jgi:GT2 family glycosyltransferase
MKVFAIIVTFNRPLVLQKCLDSLIPQIEQGLSNVHVVVNSSDPETPDLIRRYADQFFSDRLTFELQDNSGPAGGFHHGLMRFMESSVDYAWLMDDDIIVGKECLHQMLTEASGKDFIFPRVITSSGEEVVSFGWWGVLLSANLVRKAGLPMKELFYWAEDTEYLQNRIMRLLKVKPYRCKRATVHHLHNRVLKRPSWYYYYTARNTLYYRNHIVGYTWYRFKRTIYLFPYLFFSIMFREENKLRKFRLLFRGIVHGLQGKTGKTIDPYIYR